MNPGKTLVDKAVARDRYLRKNYDITLEEYNELLAFGLGGCWACGVPPKPDRNLHVDHNHKTKAVRSLMCWTCNQIGRARGPAITAARLRGIARVLDEGEENVVRLLGHTGRGK